MIDANESAEARTEEMITMVQECGLVDTHLITDPFSTIETYVRGNGKIDYIYTTPRIQQRITYTQISPYHEWIVSDHSALIVDIDYRDLERGEITEWTRPERALQSGNVANRKAFIEACHQKMVKMKWITRLEKLKKMKNTSKVEVKLNNLDREVTETLTSEESKHKRKAKPPKSKKLNEAILTHQMWRIAHKVINTRRCFRERLNEIAKNLNLKEDQAEWRQSR